MMVRSILMLMLEAVISRFGVLHMEEEKYNSKERNSVF